MSDKKEFNSQKILNSNRKTEKSKKMHRSRLIANRNLDEQMTVHKSSKSSIKKYGSFSSELKETGKKSIYQKLQRMIEKKTHLSRGTHKKTPNFKASFHSKDLKSEMSFGFFSGKQYQREYIVSNSNSKSKNCHFSKNKLNSKKPSRCIKEDAKIKNSKESYNKMKEGNNYVQNYSNSINFFLKY